MYNKQQHLHFVGIGGVGMAGIAEVLINLGYSVSGSDLKRNGLIDTLEALGAKIAIGHRAENLPSKTDCVVVSSAISDQNPEMLAAEQRGVPRIPRAEMLAELMRMKYGIAVAGSHGKTSTTSMTAKLLADMGLDPTVIIGGRVLSQTTGAKTGQGEYLVAEADESDGSFCLLRPAIAIVTNIDTEHMSHYGSFESLERSFGDFMQAVPFYGLVAANADDPVVRRLAGRLSRRVKTYSIATEADICAKNIRPEGPFLSYDLQVEGVLVERITLPMSGRHMVSNSLAAATVALELGAFPDEIASSLASFPGVARRCELVSQQSAPVLILDDYGHHPTEIRATLRAVREGWLPHHAAQLGLTNNGRLIALFEPHRYSRTKELFSDFLLAFDHADLVVVGDVYPAGEQEIPEATGERLAAALQHPSVKYCPDLHQSLKELVPDLNPGDIVITLGAGAVGKVAHQLAQILREA